MRYKRYSILCLTLLLGLLLSGDSASAKQKWAQTGFQFLSVCSDARAVGMGEAMTSLQNGSASLFLNPAGMAGLTNRVDLAVSQNSWIADINHSTFSVAVQLPKTWNLGVLGFSFQSVDYGDFYGTRIDGSELGFTDTGIFSASAMAAGVGYATYLTDRFSVGGHIRYVRQDLGESVIPVLHAGSDTTEAMASNELTPMSYDFGTQFNTGFKSLVIGMCLRNFSEEIEYVQEGFQLPLTFNIGVSMDLMDFVESPSMKQSLIVAIDAAHYRAHPEQIRVGLDYRLMDILSFRSGYVSSNEINGFSFGMGVSYAGLTLDYAYTPFKLFDNVQRMTARFAL